MLRVRRGGISADQRSCHGLPFGLPLPRDAGDGHRRQKKIIGRQSTPLRAVEDVLVMSREDPSCAHRRRSSGLAARKSNLPGVKRGSEITFPGHRDPSG